MNRHKLLNVTSRRRIRESSASTSDFIITLNNAQGLQQVKSVVVKQATIPNSMYNVSSYNNTFTYKIAGVENSVSITQGQYNVTTLIDALETALVGVGMSITVNELTSKLTFTTTTAIEYLPYPTNPMGDVLGINNGSGGDLSVFTPVGSVSLEGLKNVFIYSDKLGENNLINSQGKTFSFLGVIPIEVGYGGIEHYVTQHSELDDHDSLSVVHGKNVQVIDIKLTDVNGNILELNGHDVDLILKIFY